MKKLLTYVISGIVLTVIIAVGVILLANRDTDPFEEYEAMLKDGPTANLQIWTYYNNTQANAFNNIVNNFNDTIGREKNISVTHTPFGKTNQLADQLVKSSIGGMGATKMPNMFQAYADDVFNLDYNYNNVASLDNYFTESELSIFIDGLLAEGRYDANKSLKVVPFAKSTETLSLNKTDWDRFASTNDVSLDMLSSPEGLVQVAELYYNKTGKPFYGRDSIANMFNIESFAQDKPLYAINQLTSKATAQFNVDLFRYIYDTYYVPYVKGYFYSELSYRTDDAGKGKILSYIGSTASAGYFPKEVSLSDTEKYSISSYIAPAFVKQGTQKAAIMQGAGIAVTKTDARTEYACAVFLKYITSPENNLRMATELGYLPVLKASMEYNLIEETYVKMKLGSAGLEDNETNRNSVKIADSLVLDSYKVAVNMVKTYKMHSPTPFVNSTKIRRLLDCCIQGNKPDEFAALENAKDIIAKVNADIALGMSRDDALSKNLHGNFEKWYNKLVELANIELAK